MQCMTLVGNRCGNFLVFLEVKEGSNSRMNSVFVSEGNKAEGWWRFIEVVHEVVGIRLFPLE